MTAAPDTSAVPPAAVDDPVEGATPPTPSTGSPLKQGLSAAAAFFPQFSKHST